MDKQVKIIAEIGFNHIGDMDLAKLMAKTAKDNGADYAKFQTWSVSRLKEGDWDSDGRRQIYERAELTKEKHIELINYCNNIGIEFLSSAFSVKDAKLLKELGLTSIKIPSFECRNKELINYCNKNFKLIILSTGGTKFKEIKQSVKLIKNAELILMHCVSSYPTHPMRANLPRIKYLKKIHHKVGYSDHVEGIEAARLSLEYGVEIIEKHFTVDRNLEGRDNKLAILPNQLKELSDYIQLREYMNVFQGVDYQDIEEISRKNDHGKWQKNGDK